MKKLTLTALAAVLLLFYGSAYAAGWLPLAGLLVQDQAFAAWGDSLTFGQGSDPGKDYPDQVATGNVLINGTFAVSTGWTLGSGISVGTTSITASISGATLTVTAASGAPVAVGHVLSDTNVGVLSPNTTITAFQSGTGGTGTYTVNTSQTVASESMTATGTLDYTASGFGIAEFPMTLTPGVTYQIVWTLTGYSSGSVAPVLFGSSANFGASRGANGTYTDNIVAPAGAVSLRFSALSGTTTLAIESVTVIPQPRNGWLVFNGGVPGQTSPQIAARVVANTDQRRWTAVFWMGENNQGQTAQIVADLQQSVNYVGHNRYLVLSIPPNRSETIGTGPRTTLDATNAAINAAFPGHYVNLCLWLCTDTGGVVPFTLLYDGSLHGNNSYYAIVAGVVQNALATLPVYPPYPDTAPDAFAFTSVIGQLTSSVSTSNAVQITGINSPATITSGGDEYQINGGAWVTSDGTISNGDTVAVRHTNSASIGVTSTSTMTIGGVSGLFSSKTVTSANLAVDGDFSSSPGPWTLPSGVTISAGAAHFSAAAFPALRQDSTSFVAGKTYRLTATMSNWSAGSNRFVLFGAAVANGIIVKGANGTWTEDIVCPALSGGTTISERLAGQSGSDTYDITNFSVYQINFLLKHDVDPANNDNSPMWLEKVA